MTEATLLTEDGTEPTAPENTPAREEDAALEADQALGQNQEPSAQADNTPQDGVPESPEDYDLNVSEDEIHDPALGESLKQMAHEQGLTRDQAAAVSELYQKRLTDSVFAEATRRENLVADLRTQWQGTNFDRNLTVAKRAVRAFGSEDLLSVFNSTGIGDHPAVIKAFYAIGQAMSEDALVLGSGSPRPELQRTDAGTPMLRFPSMGD